MRRITKKDLDCLADRINVITGSPLTYVAEVDGKYLTNIGHYHISCAYGGYRLHRTMSDGGGIKPVFNGAHIKARELADQMQAYILGLQDAKE
jgi:hypothetical protein